MLSRRNIETAMGPNGRNTFTDGTHKMERRIKTQIPTSLYTDADTVFNYLCNKILFNQVDNKCCN